MPYADPDKRRQDDRERKRRARGAVKAAEVVDLAGLPDPPSRDELLKLLGAQARQGNTAAIRLLLEEHRRDGHEDTQPQPSGIDELAQRRAS